MTNLLPWPDELLAAAHDQGPRLLLSRLRALAASGGLPHALLLLGAPGLGREGLALELAAALVCREGGADGCRCASCERVRRGLHPDVTVVAVEAGHREIRIEQSRAIGDSLTRRPYESEHRVVIVATVHTPPLNSEAASALLKALEEPPAHVTLVLLASNPGRVLPTIRSRAVAVRVPRPHPATESAAAADDRREWSAEPSEEAADRDQGALAAELAALLEGDVTAVPLVCGHAREGVAPVVGALVDLAAAARDERAEACLELAAALLAAERRSRELNLEPEAVATAALAAALRRLDLRQKN